MNKVYILPKVIILFLSLVIITKLTEWYYLLLFLVGAMLVVFITVILNITLHALYYQYLIKRGKPLSKESVYLLAHRYIKMANCFMRLDVQVEHYERYDKTKNYLIIPNHQSNADATVLLEAFKSHILFVAKHQLKKVPVISTIMKQLGCLFLNKDDMRGQITVMNEVVEKLQQNNSAIIFPEGRRSFGPKLNEFKAGTFKMATKTKVDILPITLNYVYNLKDYFPWRKTEVKVYFHEPIPYDAYKDLGTQEIADMVKTIIESKIEE